jgi:hypothetical protein
MSLETQLVALLKVRCDRVFPDEAPFGTATPYVIFQQVGGQAPVYVEGAVPNRRNAEMQITVWDVTRSAANALSQQIEKDLIETTTIDAKPLGALRSSVSDLPDRRGASQDFDIWAAR